MKVYIPKSVWILVFVYALLMVSMITWGIPNVSHPFNYQMDEWHQMQSVRNLFKYGSPNIPGSAHGTIFHFFLSGLYLVPFIFTGVVNPFVVKTALNNLDVQEKLFIILRTNTLLLGVLSIIIMAIISKKYLKTSPLFTASLFVITPIWLILSNYFKYDIALCFWILLSILAILEFGKDQTFRKFITAGILSGIAIAVKISALPLIPIYIFSFFFFKNKLKLKQLFYGVGISLLIAILLGIPDILLGRGDMKEFLYSNLIGTPDLTLNFILPQPWYVYLPLNIFPLEFGYAFSITFIFALLFFLREKRDKNTMFIIVCVVFFTLSLIPLKIYAGGNRFLTLLPFLSLLIGSFIQNFKKSSIVLFIIVILCQIYQSIQTVSYKWGEDVREVSSKWILTNIPKGSSFGLEDIPIYQSLPNFILSDFYKGKDLKGYTSVYSYNILVNVSLPPKYVILTGRELDSNYFKKSEKKELIKELGQNNYKKIKEFNPAKKLYSVFGNELNMYLSGLVQVSSISIYQQR